MRTRVISGVALIILLILVLLGGAWPFLFALLLVTLLATHEFYGMARAGGYQPAYAVGMGAAFVLIADAAYGTGYEQVILIATVLLAIVWQLWSLRPALAAAGSVTAPTASATDRVLLPTSLSSDQLRQSWLNIAFTLAGVLYIPWLLRLGWAVYNYCRPDQPCTSASFGIGGIGPGIWWLVLVLVATTFADTGAYFVGSRFGKRKLIPWISPAKTVEGLIGGVFFTIIGVLLLTPVLGIAWYNALLLGPLLALAAVCGDLIESMFKRAMKVKDSGNLIPGHGGILDRIDSIILTVALVFFYITYAQFLFAV